MVRRASEQFGVSGTVCAEAGWKRDADMLRFGSIGDVLPPSAIGLHLRPE